MTHARSGKLLSISIGKVGRLFTQNANEPSKVMSAIHKQSISNLDNPLSVEITGLGVQGDEQADLAVHGGIDMAIYAYPAEHYAFWNELLTRETKQPVNLAPGSLGENFTIEGLLETNVYVGDILIIGDLEFTVVKLREPCFKFNAKMGYKGAVKAMIQSGFCGWYLRVNRVGSLAAGASIELIPGSRQTSIADQNAGLLKRSKQADLWE
ncbi:MOSC domain-containing protein [Polynucleobacter paneuropaeus]|uniref:MOSC domain-containing protein n=1 Tax=Polynucleobacter paneuropaeus TaxID=2527775 RepID=UPI000DBF1BFD|nr:MOSC domain-containing protein [Polynucleobacter paneuropaeus]AWW48527.1 MOSC domain-containing protein [Polynucleobacter paneuropaeus]MBT8607316.1 MOSC domain-containing protein [Polynucleobacter paneuropaeus]